MVPGRLLDDDELAFATASASLFPEAVRMSLRKVRLPTDISLAEW
jgi:hypothetical protein